VVGDLEEGPAAGSQVYRDRFGRLRVPGTMRLDEVGQYFDLDLEHEEVDSVSGLILTLLGRPPVVGDSVKWERLQVEVTAVKGHGVEEAAVCLTDMDSGPSEGIGL
jgi:CBS domain containing-hemolysin-like protein